MSMTLEAVNAPATTLTVTNLDELRVAHTGSFRSAATRNAYSSDLDAFVDFATSHGAAAFPARRVLIDAWCRHMESQVDEHGRRILSDATISRRLGALSSLHRYAVDEGLIEANPVSNVRRPARSDESTTQGLTRNEARRLIAEADAMGERTALLVRLLLHNGLRVSEALGIRVDDIFEQGDHLVVKITGKGNRPKVAPLNAPTRRALEVVVADRPGTDFVLQTAKGTPLDRHNVSKLVATLATRCGISKRISPHSLRHTAITVALDAGVPLHIVQDFARHADPRTTRRYDLNANRLDEHAAYTLADQFDPEGSE